MRTPDVAARNVVAMAGSRGAAEARPRASARTRRPSLKARACWAQPADCDHADKPQAAGGARRGGRAAAPEGLRLLTPAPRQGSTVCIPMLTSACSSAPELDRQATPDSRHGAPRLGYRERLGTRRAVKRSTARRSTAGSTAIREHAVTAVGIRTNETLQHTFRTGRRAAATRATHGRAGEAPPTVCQQPARVVRDESWDESWTPYYNLYQAPHVTLLVQMVPPGANPEIRIRKFIFCVGFACVCFSLASVSQPPGPEYHASAQACAFTTSHWA